MENTIPRQSFSFPSTIANGYLLGPTKSDSERTCLAVKTSFLQWDGDPTPIIQTTIGICHIASRQVVVLGCYWNN